MSIPFLNRVFLLASLTFFHSTFAEFYSVPIVQQFEAKKNYSFVEFNELANNSNYNTRKITKIEIFIFPTTKSDVILTLNLQNINTAKTLNFYEPDDLLKVKSVEFNLNSNFSTLKTLKLSFSSNVGITAIRIHLDDIRFPITPTDTINSHILKLKELSEHNLFEEDNREIKDKIIRFEAVSELAQYPYIDSAKILLERYQYQGLNTDYDLKSLSKKSLELLIDHSTNAFGEKETMNIFNALTEEVESFESQSMIFEKLYDFKTSAGILYIIYHHLYSPTFGRELYNGAFIQKYLNNEDLIPYFNIYQNELNDLFLSGHPIVKQDSAYWEWSKERACQLLIKDNSSLFIKALWKEIYTTRYLSDCRSAFSKIIRANHADLANALTPITDELIKVITEPYRTYFNGFTYPESLRVDASYLLCFSKTPKAKNALNEALLIKNLEPNVLKQIQESLKCLK